MEWLPVVGHRPNLCVEALGEVPSVTDHLSGDRIPSLCMGGRIGVGYRDMDALDMRAQESGGIARQDLHLGGMAGFDPQLDLP